MTQTQVYSHIDHALVPRTHPPMYLIHKYWARKPHNVVHEYIEHYTRPNEIVLDPFCGSGVTVFEALKGGRIAVGFDLNPVSVSIIESTLEQVDSDQLDKAFEKILWDVKERIEELYKITCPNCHNKNAVTRYVVWSHVVVCPSCGKKVTMADAKRPKGKKQNIYKCPLCNVEFSYANVPILGEAPISVTMDCNVCGMQSQQSPKLKLPEVDLTKVWYPKIRFSYNGDRPFVTKRRASKIEELYTPRNLFALALLFKAISKIPDAIGKVLRVTFSSMIPQASKMMIVTETQGPGWKMPEYLIWATHCEFNVWSRFVNRFKAVKRGLEDRNKTIATGKVAKDFQSLLSGDGNAFVDRLNAVEISSKLPADSVDYVFTDPPYGGAIQYFELDVLRAAWFHEEDDLAEWWKEEITVNPRGQGKDFDYYHKMLSASFSQIYHVLKPDHFLTVTFHSTDIDVWNSIIIAVRLAGFELEKIIYQPPAKASAKAMLQPYGSAVGDYYIRFRKPKQEKEVTREQVDKDKYRRVVIETTKKIIANRGEPTPFTFILNGIIPELDKQGVFFVDKRGSKGIEEVLKGRIGIDFVLKPILDKSGKEVGSGWWFKDPSSIPYLETVPLNERVEKLVINILNNRVKVAFDDVLQEVFKSFPNALTPNTQSVREVLEEYASKTQDKKWMLKPRFRMRLKEHDVIVKNLAELGQQLGFEVHADIDGFRRMSFPFDVENQNRVKEIDVIWFANKDPIAIFEVENTTGVTEAIVRGGNIKSQEVLRVIVMPEERRRFLKRKVREPILKDQIVKYNWHMLTYDELNRFLSDKKGEPTLKNLMVRIVSLTNFRVDAQAPLHDFLKP